MASEGARQKATARATKKKIASTFSLSIDPDNWLSLPTNTGGPDAGKLNFRMLKRANNQKAGNIEKTSDQLSLISINRSTGTSNAERSIGICTAIELQLMPESYAKAVGGRVLADLNALRAIGSFKSGVHKPTFSEAHLRSLEWYRCDFLTQV